MGTDKMCWYKWEHKQLFSLRHRVCPSASPFFSWLNHVEAPFSTRNAPCFMVKPAGACQGEDVDASDSFCRGEPRWMSTMSTKDRNSHTWNSVYCRCRCGCRCIFFEFKKTEAADRKFRYFGNPMLILGRWTGICKPFPWGICGTQPQDIRPYWIDDFVPCLQHFYHQNHWPERRIQVELGSLGLIVRLKDPRVATEIRSNTNLFEMCGARLRVMILNGHQKLINFLNWQPCSREFPMIFPLNISHVVRFEVPTLVVHLLMRPHWKGDEISECIALRSSPSSQEQAQPWIPWGGAGNGGFTLKLAFYGHFKGMRPHWPHTP